jgi:hypothetical protein
MSTAPPRPSKMSPNITKCPLQGKIYSHLRTTSSIISTKINNNSITLSTTIPKLDFFFPNCPKMSHYTWFVWIRIQPKSHIDLVAVSLLTPNTLYIFRAVYWFKKVYHASSQNFPQSELGWFVSSWCRFTHFSVPYASCRLAEKSRAFWTFICNWILLPWILSKTCCLLASTWHQGAHNVYLCHFLWY